MSLTFVPYFAYEDAAAAIDYLERCFGFVTSARYADDDGVIQHAELHFGSGTIMLGTGTDQQRDTNRPTVPPGRGIYVVVDDVDAHFTRAEKAGVTTVYPPEDTEFGTRRWRALDAEGYEWSFGTYVPATAE